MKKSTLAPAIIAIALMLSPTAANATVWEQSTKTALGKATEYANNSWNDGSRYKGQTADDGSITGLGIYKASSIHYLGDFYKGQKNGYGINMTHDGYHVSNCNECVVYVGNFNSDNKSGKGACYDEDGNLIYYGVFSNDRPTDTYPMTKNYSAYKFQTIVYTNGSKYIGETKDGSRAGYGIFVFDNGSAWLGNWKNGIRSGKGIYLSYDASLWETQNCNGDNCTKYTSSEDQKATAARAAAEQQRQYQQQQQEQQQDALAAGVNAFVGVVGAITQTRQGYNSGGNNNYYDNSGGGGANCSSYQRRYSDKKSYIDRERESNSKMQYNIGKKNAFNNVDPTVYSAPTGTEYRNKNNSNHYIREAERDLDKIAREARKAGCNVY